jgi:nitroreductase
MAMGLGCALENMRVAAESLGYRAIVEAEADAAVEADGRCASLRLSRAGTPSRHPWLDALFLRQTTRTAFEDAPVPREVRDALLATCSFPALGMSWSLGLHRRRRVSDIAGRSVRLFLADDRRHRDGMRWFRITRREWEQTGDGISIFTSDASVAVKQWVEWFATREDLLGQRFKDGEIDYVDRTSAATPLWGLVWSQGAHPTACLEAGQVAERVYLEATARGYAICPMSYPTELAESLPALREAFGLAPSAIPLWLFRVGRAPRLERSVRRRLGEVIA